MKISELKPLEKNPFKSKGDEQIQKIADSIKSFEKMLSIRKIIIDENNQILGGNKRFFALKKLGYKNIPDEWIERVTGLTEAEKREFIVKDNSHWGSEWDYEILSDWNVDLVEWGVPECTFESEPEVLDAEEDDFDVPEGGIETYIVLGDLFEIGNHRLLCGDSTDSDSVSKLMNGEKADMVFTDPPYGISIVGNNCKVGGDNKAKNGIYSKVIADDTTDTAKDFYNTCISLGMENFIIWGGNYFVDFLPFSASWIIWDKRGDMNSNNFADGEMAWCSFETRVRIYKQLWNGMIREGEKDRRVHPTQKPIKVLSDIITDQIRGDLIFDGFGGSGSTMVACHQVKKKCFMIEMSPKYCQVIVDRMRKLDPTLVIKKNGIVI
jgi:DNA modification methylase